MHHAQQLDSVRQLVEERFRDHGVYSPDELMEKILIRDGFYCGRCFLCDGYRAVWFVEEHTVKFYGPDSGFLCACSIEQGQAEPERRVA